MSKKGKKQGQASGWGQDEEWEEDVELKKSEKQKQTKKQKEPEKSKQVPEKSSKFSDSIEKAIQEICKINFSQYKPSDPKAFANIVYKQLESKVYGEGLKGDKQEIWEKQYGDKKKNTTITSISQYVQEYIPQYQEQQYATQLSSEEQQVQSLLQKHKQDIKHTGETLQEKNTEAASEKILALDAMSRIFNKNPYSSLVYNESEGNTLYLGINSNEPNVFLKDVNTEIVSNPNVQKSAAAFEAYINEPNDKNISVLLGYLQEDKNPILGNILFNMGKKPDITLLALSEKERKEIIGQLLSNQEVGLIRKHGFHEKEIVESYPYGHGEMNALAEGRGLRRLNTVPSQNEKSEYIIGLAAATYRSSRSDSQGGPPFCCMGCSAEIEVLRTKRKLDISVGYTSIDSMRYSELYRPSLNMVRDKELTQAWCEEMEMSITEPAVTRKRRLERQEASIRNFSSNEVAEESKKEQKKKTKIDTKATSFDSKTKEEKSKTKSLTGNRWYGDDQIISILSSCRTGQLVTGEPNEILAAEVRQPVSTRGQLQTALGRIQQMADGDYVIPMRVNITTRGFGEEEENNRNNHWVGVHVRRTGGHITGVNYVDPTGERPNGEIASVLQSRLGQNINNVGIQLQYGEIVTDQGTDVIVTKWKGNGDDCGPLMIHMLEQVATTNGIAILQVEAQGLTLEGSKALGQSLRQEQQQLQNSHLKRSEKLVSETYDIKESFAAMNPNNTELLEKIRTEAVITADIDLKGVDVQESVTRDKVGKVEFLAEGHHIRDHGGNTKSLIERIESGDIDKDTVIAIERKSYGQNLGVPDVIMLASIIEYNAKNPDKQLQIPEEITKDSLIYQDAVLYNTAKKHGVKVVGLEGRNLKAGKDSPEYDEAREEYMASRITQLTSKGYNVVAYVGSAHVNNLKKIVENKPSVENTPNKVSEELQKMAASIGQQARAHVTQSFTTTASSIPVLPNEKQPIKQNNGIGSR